MTIDLNEAVSAAKYIKVSSDHANKVLIVFLLVLMGKMQQRFGMMVEREDDTHPCKSSVRKHVLKKILTISSKR